MSILRRNSKNEEEKKNYALKWQNIYTVDTTTAYQNTS